VNIYKLISLGCVSVFIVSTGYKF